MVAIPYHNSFVFDLLLVPTIDLVSWYSFQFLPSLGVFNPIIRIRVSTFTLISNNVVPFFISSHSDIHVILMHM